MKKQCDVCRALVYRIGEWPKCVLGIEVGMKVRDLPDGTMGTPYPAPTSECPKPVTRESLAEELKKRAVVVESISVN